MGRSTRKVEVNVDVILEWSEVTTVRWNKAQAEYDIGNAPDTDGIYAIYYDGHVMYVGEAGDGNKYLNGGNLYARLLAHFSEAILCSNDTSCTKMKYYYAIGKDLLDPKIRKGCEAVLIRMAYLYDDNTRNKAAAAGANILPGYQVIIDNKGDVPDFIVNGKQAMLDEVNGVSKRGKTTPKLIVTVS